MTALPGRSRLRSLLVVLGIAAGSAALGLYAGRSVQSPDDAARDARAPKASAITAVVERKVLSTVVVTRGDIGTTESVELTADAVGGTDPGASGGAPVVTGRLPREGARLGAGEVAIEVSGRPVLLLAGERPMYRTLRPGAEGADVRQLEAGLAGLGFAPGKADGRYDSSTERAVAAWYGKRGYQPAGPTREEEQQLDAAATQVKNARTALRAAQLALDTAPPGQPRRALRRAVDDARADLAQARREYAGLDARIGVTMPRAELAFVRSLPVTVAKVKARIGRPPEGTMLTLAGGTPQVEIDLAPDYRRAVKIGGRADIDDETLGLHATGVITQIADRPGTSGAAPGMYRIRVRPDRGLSAADGDLDVRVRIPIASTGGKVLTVPEIALFTRADGGTYVHLRAPGGAVREVRVETGIAAEGLVEIRPAAGGSVKEGDEVVVEDR